MSDNLNFSNILVLIIGILIGVLIMLFFMKNTNASLNSEPENEATKGIEVPYYWYKKYPNDEDLKEKLVFYVIRSEMEKLLEENPYKEEIIIFSKNLKEITKLYKYQEYDIYYGDFVGHNTTIFLSNKNDPNPRSGIFIKDVYVSKEDIIVNNNTYTIYFFGLSEETIHFKIKEQHPAESK